MNTFRFIAYVSLIHACQSLGFTLVAADDFAELVLGTEIQNPEWPVGYQKLVQVEVNNWCANLLPTDLNNRLKKRKRASDPVAALRVAAEYMTGTRLKDISGQVGAVWPVKGLGWFFMEVNLVQKTATVSMFERHEEVQRGFILVTVPKMQSVLMSVEAEAEEQNSPATVNAGLAQVSELRPMMPVVEFLPMAACG